MKLTRRQREILTVMVSHPHDDEGELVCSIPGGWYLGTDRVGGKTGFSLLRSCLISADSFSDETMQRYRANSYAAKALNDPAWNIAQEIKRGANYG